MKTTINLRRLRHLWSLLLIGINFTSTAFAQQEVNESSSTLSPVSPTTTKESRTYYDSFLTFPPEYVALLGLGILFLILFAIVIVIICVTARHKKKY